MQLVLTPYEKEGFNLVRVHNGLTISELAKSRPDSQRDQELNIAHVNKKGSLGGWFEWFITGKKPSSLKEPDLVGWDIKTITVRNGKKHKLPTGQTPQERLRITDCNYNTVQKEKFCESALAHKSRMIVFLTEEPKKSCPLGDRIVREIGTIDLSTPETQAQLEEDYNNVRLLAESGQAHKISCREVETRPGRIQPGKLAQTNSHSGPKVYQDALGNDCSIKTPMSFYLFPSKIVKYFKLLTEENTNVTTNVSQNVKMEYDSQEKIVNELLTF